MITINKNNFENIINQYVFFSLYFDAEWQVCKELKDKFLIFADLHQNDNQGFGIVDLDQEPDVASNLGILNVPGICYFKDGKLIEIKIGINQDIKEF